MGLAPYVSPQHNVSPQMDLRVKILQHEALREAEEAVIARARQIQRAAPLPLPPHILEIMALASLSMDDLETILLPPLPHSSRKTV